MLGSDGVTVETNAGGIYLGDLRFEPLWHELDERAAAVFVHPTSPPGADALSQGRPRPVLEFIFDSTRAAADLVFSEVLSRCPRIRWIFTHGGGNPASSTSPSTIVPEEFQASQWLWLPPSITPQTSTTSATIESGMPTLRHFATGV